MSTLKFFILEDPNLESYGRWSVCPGERIKTTLARRSRCLL